MDLPCYKTKDCEFHSKAYWVFIDENGEIAHMPTTKIKWHCFNCGKTWLREIDKER